MSTGDMLKILVVGVLVMNMGVGWWLVRTLRGGKLMTDMRGVCTTLSAQMHDFTSVHSGLDKRVAVLEARVQQMPSHVDLANIRGELREMNKSISTVAETTAGIGERANNTSHTVQLIHEHLLRVERS